MTSQNFVSLAKEKGLHLIDDGSWDSGKMILVEVAIACPKEAPEIIEALFRVGGTTKYSSMILEGIVEKHGVQEVINLIQSKSIDEWHTWMSDCAYFLAKKLPAVRKAAVNFLLGSKYFQDHNRAVEIIVLIAEEEKEFVAGLIKEGKIRKEYLGRVACAMKDAQMALDAVDGCLDDERLIGKAAYIGELLASFDALAAKKVADKLKGKGYLDEYALVMAQIANSYPEEARKLAAEITSETPFSPVAYRKVRLSWVAAGEIAAALKDTTLAKTIIDKVERYDDHKLIAIIATRFIG